jgi:hypothetical protein
MSHESKRTTDHNTIKKWAEERQGKPAVVETTEEKGDKNSGILRIDFPGYAEDNLKEISWDKFFKTFDEHELEFLYQEDTKEGSPSRFFKMVSNNSQN